MSDIYGPFALKLHAFGLERLHDPNWTGMELFDRLKQHTRGRREPVTLLREPLERGLLYWLGIWLLEDFLSDGHFEDLDPEHRAWFLEDLVALLKKHRIRGSGSEIRSTSGFLRRVDAKYEQSEDHYFAYLESENGNDAMNDGFKNMLAVFEPNRERLQAAYASNFSDRVFHDRELCGYVAHLTVRIGFDGDDNDSGTPRQWVQRVRWPERVKTMLRARDRGKCSQCGRDLLGELLADPHIDHIVPIARGGCNDIVNLQILCDRCNLKKRAGSLPAKSSVPRYIRRGEGSR